MTRIWIYDDKIVKIATYIFFFDNQIKVCNLKKMIIENLENHK